MRYVHTTIVVSHVVSQLCLIPSTAPLNVLTSSSAQQSIKYHRTTSYWTNMDNSTPAGRRRLAVSSLSLLTGRTLSRPNRRFVEEKRESHVRRQRGGYLRR